MFACLKEASTILFQILVLCLFFTIIYPIFVINYILRILTCYTYKIFAPSESYLLGSSWSSAFNWPANKYPYVSIYGLVEGSIDINTVKSQVENICLKNKLFKFQLLNPNFFGFCWYKRRKDFSVNNHVLQLQVSDLVNDGMNKVDVNSMLQILLVEREFSSYKPHWEIVIIPEYEIGKSLVTVRMHHAYGDGVSLMLLANSLLKDPLFNNFGYSSVSQPNALNVCSRKLRAIFSGPLIYAKYCLIPLILHKANNINSSMNVKQSKSSQIFVVRSTKTMNSNCLKLFRQKNQDISISALLIDAVNRSVRKTSLVRKPDEILTINLITTPAMDLKGSPVLCNRIVHSAIRISEHETKTRIQKFITFGNRRHYMDYFLKFWMIWISYLPNGLASQLVRFSSMPIFFTNLPTVSNQVKIKNIKLVEAGGFSAMVANIGLSIAFMTYNGKMRAFLTTNSNMFPDIISAQHFADLLLLEVSQLI